MPNGNQMRLRAAFWVLWVLPLLTEWRSVAATYTLAWTDDQYTHILLIIPITAALIYLDWYRLRSQVAPNVAIGSVLLVLAVLIAFVPRWSGSLSQDVRVSIDMFALVLWWIGAFVLCYGTRISKSMLFPLCFLFWLVPFPTFLLNGIVSFLQRESASVSHSLFAAAGVPVLQNGVILTIPGVTIEVAKECSSIRSSLMLLVTTMVLAHLVLRSFWRKAAVIALAVPLSVAKNGLRIFTIAMLGIRVDPGFLTGKLHHHGGVVFFLIALGAIFLCLWVLQRGEGGATPTLLPGQHGRKIASTA